MAKKDVFQEDKFGVRFFIYNRKKYFVVNDLNGSHNKNTLGAIERFLKKDPKLRIFGSGEVEAKPPKFCLSFASYKILNKQEIKEAIEKVDSMTLSDVSIEWLTYHKIKVSVRKRRQQTRCRSTAEELFRGALRYKITTATNHITENKEIV